MTTAEKCTKVLQLSYGNSNTTQQHIAEELKVSRRTICNWLDGFSQPTYPQSIEWYSVLNESRRKWENKMSYFDNEEPADPKIITHDEMKKELKASIDNLTNGQIERMYYTYCFDNGSAPEGLIELNSMYSHLPFEERYKIASFLRTIYEMSESNGKLVNEGLMMPNTTVFDGSMDRGWKIIRSGL